mmetsp:Transcript_86457/g.155720  ORF Transcript_86457/g.155720 Transcript_86457/m.155720 type:complete len:205 (-) Transcript_86457:839-1453(-)
MPSLRAPEVRSLVPCSHYARFCCNQRFDEEILDAAQHETVIKALRGKVLLEILQRPLGGPWGLCTLVSLSLSTCLLPSAPRDARRLVLFLLLVVLGLGLVLLVALEAFEEAVGPAVNCGKNELLVALLICSCQHLCFLVARLMRKVAAVLLSAGLCAALPLRVAVLDVCSCMFVHRIVGEMHRASVERLRGRRVLFGGQSHEPL